MAIRFDLVGRTKVKLTNVVVLSLKRGQRELDPGATLRLKMRTTADILTKFGARFIPFAYKKPSAPAKQQMVDGVSPRMELTEEAVLSPEHKLAGYEQTGVNFIIHRGVSKLSLPDCKVSKVKLTLLEDEVVDVEWNVATGVLDEETLGALAALKQHELDVEQLLPEVLEDLAGKVDPLTPIGALSKSARRGKQDVEEPTLQ